MPRSLEALMTTMIVMGKRFETMTRDRERGDMMCDFWHIDKAVKHAIIENYKLDISYFGKPCLADDRVIDRLGRENLDIDGSFLSMAQELCKRNTPESLISSLEQELHVIYTARNERSNRSKEKIQKLILASKLAQQDDKHIKAQQEIAEKQVGIEAIAKGFASKEYSEAFVYKALSEQRSLLESEALKLPKEIEHFGVLLALKANPEEAETPLAVALEVANVASYSKGRISDEKLKSLEQTNPLKARYLRFVNEEGLPGATSSQNKEAYRKKIAEIRDEIYKINRDYSRGAINQEAAYVKLLKFQPYLLSHTIELSGNLVIFEAALGVKGDKGKGFAPEESGTQEVALTKPPTRVDGSNKGGAGASKVARCLFPADHGQLGGGGAMGGMIKPSPSEDLQLRGDTACARLAEIYREKDAAKAAARNSLNTSHAPPVVELKPAAQVVNNKSSSSDFGQQVIDRIAADYKKGDLDKNHAAGELLAYYEQIASGKLTLTGDLMKDFADIFGLKPASSEHQASKSPIAAHEKAAIFSPIAAAASAASFSSMAEAKSVNVRGAVVDDMTSARNKMKVIADGLKNESINQVDAYRELSAFNYLFHNGLKLIPELAVFSEAFWVEVEQPSVDALGFGAIELN